jgi:hypothetical protein
MRATTAAVRGGMLGLLLAAAGGAGAAGATDAQGVTVLDAARIHTMDPARPQAEALAYDAGGRILAVGSRAELAARYPGARHVDAGAATVVPGLIDAHGHVEGLGLTRMRVDLVGTKSRADVLQRLRDFARTLAPGQWLLGRGWDQNDWPERAFPTAADLDAAFPDRPVWLERVDGHAAWANTAAMRAATRDVAGGWQPEGGQIVRDAQGRATGVFVDDAMALIDAAVPPMDEAMAERALELGMQDAVRHGLTGVHDAGITLAQFRRYQRLADAGRMPLRVSAMGEVETLELLCREGPYAHPSGRLGMRMLKLHVDGALGSRGAALLADYSDDAGNRGLLRLPVAELRAVVARARRCGVQPASHAIGDRGNREVLDAYAAALGKDAATDHRWRIEHAQVLAPEDLPRLGELGVIASMQPTHATSDMPWAQDRIGPRRIHGSYAWRQLRDHGVRLALGSDFPVESVDPRLGLYAATTRADADLRPAGGWRPEEALTAWEALRGFTLDAAHAAFDDADVGSLAVGKRADFVLLAEDPLAVPPARLRALPVLATYVDGRVVYEAAGGN